MRRDPWLSTDARIQTGSLCVSCGTLPVCCAALDILAFGQLSVQIIRPPLHHRCSLTQVPGVIVCSGHFIALQMSELRFNVFIWEVVLMQDRGCQSAKTMTGHPTLITKTIKRKQNCVVAHWSVFVMRARENEPAPTGQQTERTQNFQGLARQRNDMRRLHLHSL